MRWLYLLTLPLRMKEWDFPLIRQIPAGNLFPSPLEGKRTFKGFP